MESLANLKRVSGMALLLGREVGVADTDLDDLIMSAALHDIGKSEIPLSILDKPGPLTSEEWQTMQLHTLYGERILAANKVPHRVREVALTHHEKWDGTGYPLGLRGTEIPIFSRIVAVADVYDALISRRVYKPPFSLQVTLSHIFLGRENHFDPALLDALFRLLPTMRTVH